MTSASGAFNLLPELKGLQNIPSSNTDYDFSLSLALGAAWGDAEDHAGRILRGAYSQTRTYTALNSTYLDTDDLLSITALRTDSSGNGSYGTTLSSTCYLLVPRNATLTPDPEPYTGIQIAFTSSAVLPTIQHGVQIVGVFGYATAPSERIKAAILFQAGLNHRAKDAPFGTVGGRDFTMDQSANFQVGLHPFTRTALARMRRRVVA